MSGRRHALRRLRHAHHVVATVVLNAFGIILAVSVALAVIFWMKDRRGYIDDLYAALDHTQIAALFPGRSRAEVARIWSDVVQPLTYQPFTEFRERPRRTPFVHVDEAGFRHVAGQGPWPPDPARTNVFVFGGSTTFGYGVADDDTIPSRLQPLLRARRRDVAVYNFGRGFYYSTQERILFEQLLLAGHVPHLAIFTTA